MEPGTKVPMRSLWTTSVTSTEVNNTEPAEMTKVEQILGSTTVLIIMLLAITANTSVIIVILRNENLRRNGHNILILNLAVADLCKSFGSMLITFVAYFNNGAILRRSSFACSLNVSLSIVCYFGNFGAIVSIAVHRYLLVVQSNRFNVTITYSYVMIVASWIIAVVFTIPSATGWVATIEYIPEIHHCGQNWLENCPFSLIAITFPYVLVIPLMIFCYTSIALEIRESQRKIANFQMKVRSSFHKLRARDKRLGIVEEETEMSSSQVVRTDYGDEEDENVDDDDDVTFASLSSPEERHGMCIKDWEEYEREYQEICYTLRRAGSVLDPPRYSAKRSKVKSKSTVRKRHLKLRSVLGADKLVAIAGALVVMTTFVCWTPYNIVKIKLCWDGTNASLKTLLIVCRWLSYSNSAIDPIIYSMFNKPLHKALIVGYRRFFEKLKCRCYPSD